MEESNKITPPLPKGYEPIKKENSYIPPLPSGYEPILKKKESTQLTSQESVWGSNSQPKDVYTSLVTDQQKPQQVSAISDGEQPKPILKGLPSVESLKKKPIQPKKETARIIKDIVPKVTKAISIEKGKEDFSEATQKARKESKSLVDKKQIDQKISEVSNLQNEYAKSLKDIELAKKTLSDEKSEIDYQLSIGNNTPEFQQKIALHNAKVQENLDKFNLLRDKSEVINYNKKVIESASGNLLRNKAEQGNWFGAIYNTMLEKASSMASSAVSRTVDLFSEIIPSEYLISPKELKGLKDKGLDQNQIDDYIKKSAKKDVLPAIRKGNVELFGDKGTTEEYIRKKESSGLIEKGVLGLTGSLPAMLGGVYGRATNFFLMGSDAIEQEMESNPDFQNISENEKLSVIVPIGIANAVLEEFGLQGVMKNNSIVNNLVHKTLLKVGADASASTFKRAMNNEVKSGIAAGLFKVGSGFTSEFITGGSQQGAEIGIKDIYNVVKDKKMFQTPETLSDAVSQISDAAIAEGIGGTIMSTLPAINTAMQNNDLGKKSTDFEFEILDSINENSEEFKKLFTTDLKNKMIEGKITKAEAEDQLKSFDKMTSTFNRMPKDMSIEDKKKSFDLLVEKDKLTDEINGKDESLSTKQKERIAEINKELSDISLGVKQEQKPEEVTPIETTEVETTVEEVTSPTTETTQITPQAYVEELAKTKESDPEAYWSVSEVSPEDAAKGTIIDTPDGSALVKPDGDIAGLFKKLTSKAKGVAQDLLNKAVDAGGIKLDNFDGYLTKQYEKAGFRIVSRVPFSLEYGVPDGYNKEKHGTPDVVAMVYDPNNELEIEEKTFDDYDEAMAYRDSFVDQAKINTEVKGLSNLFDESEKSNDLPLLVQKAKTSLSNILPNVDVVLYDTESDYYNAVGEEDNSGGAFINNTVHINPNRANGRTVAHEVFHAVLLNKVKSDPEAQRITSEMIKSVEKVLTPDMKAKLQDFVESGYDTQKNLWNEEKLAELIGFLAENYDTLPQPTQNIIKQWLDQLAKLVGIKEFTDKEVVDFMNTLSGKVASGEVITEGDVEVLSGGKKISNTFDYFKRKQIIGEKAVKDKVVQDNLTTAKEMEAAKKSAEDIFIATGWEKGPDNKWKYDLQEGVVEFKNKKNGKASEVINYPELFKAYPKAKNIDIVFMNSDKFEGMYIPSKNRIMLSNSLSDSEAKSTLLHEVQHFVQHEEGFAVGGNSQTIKDLYNARIKYEKNFSVRKVLNNIKNSLFKPNPESVKEDLDKLSKLVSKSDEELYRSIAGEVEAFNVEKRANMTAEERKATPISETAEVPVRDQLIVSKSDTMLKERLQKINGIDNMVRVAKEAKYSDAAIKSYLSSKGFTEDQIKSAFESYLSEDDAYNKFNETFEKAKKELENKRTVKEYFKDKYRNLLKNWSNRQVEVQSLLANTGMINTLNLNINSHGYSGRAKKTFEESYDKIYKGLNTEKRDMLDKVIQAKRFIAIDNNRAERGLDPVKHPNFLNKDTNEKYLNKLKSEIGSKSFEDLNSRANEYFKTYKKLLKDVYENGLINKEAYDSMSDIDYQPRVFLKFVTDFEGDIKTNKNNVDSTGLGSSQIKAMTEGSASSLVSNSEWLLSNSLVARTNAIAKNNINKRFMTDEFQKAKERFKKLDPKNLKGDDKRFYEYFKELNSKVIENPVVGKNENGSLKFKYDGVKNPENFTKAFYYVDGVQYSFFLEDGLYKSWTDTIDGFIDKGTKEMLSYASGSALVKAIATGNNPAFLIVNTPRDLMFTAAFSEEYNDLIPVALAQIGKDVVKSVREISKKDSDILNKYFEYGGAMDFLSSQGTLKKNSMLGEFLSKMVPPNVRDNIKGLFNAVTLKKISEYSELMFRLGIFQRSISNSLKELGYKDISEIKDKQQVDDIYNSAVASARGILDFNKGGLATKDLESIIPYVNVAFQSGSVALNAFKKRPAATTSRVIQIATMASTIPAGISLMLIAANKDDDDEKTVHEIYLDAISGISKYQKSKYMNIVTGMKDEDGQYMIIKIAKAQELSPVISVTDNILENSVRKMAGKELKSNSDIAREALFSLKSNVLPIDVTSPSATVVRNPMIKAILTYQTGYDFFREEPLSMKLESKPAPYEGMDMKSVESFYKKLGPSAGLSPVRSKAFVESLITTPATNPFIGFLYGGAEAMTSDKEAKEVGSNLIKNLKRSTLKRLVSYTSDFNRNLDTQNKLNDEIEEIKLKDAIQNSKIKEISDEFISNKISESKFVSGLKDLSEFDRRRAFNKAKDKKGLKNIDANIIDIKYEKDAEIKALMIKSYYGDILDGSEDSERVRMQMIRAKGILTPEVLSELEKKQPAN